MARGGGTGSRNKKKKSADAAPATQNGSVENQKAPLETTGGDVKQGNKNTKHRKQKVGWDSNTSCFVCFYNSCGLIYYCFISFRRKVHLSFHRRMTRRSLNPPSWSPPVNSLGWHRSLRVRTPTWTLRGKPRSAR